MTHKTTRKQSFKSIFFSGFSKFKVNVKKNSTAHFVIFGLFMAVAFLAPYYDWIPGTGTTNSQLARVMYYAVAAMGLNLLLGFGGLISLAVAGFFGIGVIVPAFMIVQYEWSFIAASLFALFVSGLAGVVVGLFSLKVDGIYLAIGTLFIGTIITNIFTNVLPISSSNIRLNEGITIFGKNFNASLSYIARRTGEAQYDRYQLLLIITAILVVAMIVINNIIKSRTGRAFMAMSRSDSAAQAMGVSIAKYRVMAFTVSTMFATLGGIMYLLWNQDAIKYGWGLDLTLSILAVVVVGGFKSIWGMLLGSFVVFAVPQLYIQDYITRFSSYLDETHGISWSGQGFTSIFAGLLIIIVILFYPNGLVYIWYDLKKLYYRIKPHALKGLKKLTNKIKSLKAGDDNGKK